MGRLSDMVINSGATPYNRVGNTINITHGGQFGALPGIGRRDLDGLVKQEWLASQKYVKKNVIPVVLTYPLFFNFKFKCIRSNYICYFFIFQFFA